MPTDPLPSTRSATTIPGGAKGSDESPRPPRHSRPAVVDWRCAFRFHDHQLHRPANAFAIGAVSEGRLSLVEHGLRVSGDRLSFRLLHRANRSGTPDRSDWYPARTDAHRCGVLAGLDPHAAGDWVLQLWLLPLPAGCRRIRKLARRHQGGL